jgi:hypothetical protein
VNAAELVQARFDRFRQDTAGSIELGLALLGAGDDESGEIVRPLLVIDGEVEKALAGGDYEAADELLDVARDSPREIFACWRENARAQDEIAYREASAHEKLGRRAGGPEGARLVAAASRLREAQARLSAFRRQERHGRRPDPKLLVDALVVRARQAGRRPRPRERCATSSGGRGGRASPRPDDDPDPLARAAR